MNTGWHRPEDENTYFANDIHTIDDLAENNMLSI
jgi:hypothetical protein